MKCLLIIISDPARAGLYGALALQAGVRVIQAEGALHVRNAPSPAATSALALAELIADRALVALD